MPNITSMDDSTLVEELPSLWAHTKSDFVAFPVTAHRPFHGGFRMEMHRHDWYFIMRLDNNRRMEMRTCVLDAAQPMLEDRLILKTIIPPADLLWLPTGSSQRLVTTEFDRIIKRANRVDLPHVCRDVLRMMRTFLMQKLDTPTYRQDLQELIDSAEW